MKKLILALSLAGLSTAYSEPIQSVDNYIAQPAELVVMLQKCAADSKEKESKNCHNAKQAQAYINKQKAMANEAYAMNADARIAASKTYSISNGDMPSSNQQAGLPPPTSITSEYVESVTLSEGGKITSLLKSGEALVVKPITTNPQASIKWVCDEDTTIQYEYLPVICKQTLKPKN